MKKTNRLIIFLIGLLTISGLGSCGQDRWPEYYPFTGRDLWIDSVMRENYLWFEEMPTFNELNYFLNPQAFLDKVRSAKDKGFSKVDTLNAAPLPTYGFNYSLSKVPENDTAYYAMITYVMPQSPAAEAGLKRGEWIMKVNNDFITRKNESILSEGEDKKLTIGTYSERTETDENGKEQHSSEIVNNREVTIEATRSVEEVVIPVSALLQNGKIAYLVYNRFDTACDDELRAFSQTCQTSGITDFILDLRYNEGGNMQSAVLLADMLVPAQALGSRFASLQYNSKQTQKNKELILDAQLLANGSNLNLQRVYILTDKKTAGTAEMLINCLNPYMEVILIGETTKGEYVATEAFPNPHYQWVVYPAVCEVFNANGKADYQEGWEPHLRKNALNNPAQVLPLGNPKEALLSTALGLIEGSIQLPPAKPSN